MFDRRTFLVLMGATGAAPLARAQMPAPMPVLASFSILGDMARQIGGARIAVTVLIGPDQDAHSFRLTPDHARRAGAARVILVNGLGFEPFLDRLLKSAGNAARPVVASSGIRPLDRPKTTGHDHAHGEAADPHAWLSVANARTYADTIAEALIAADPAGSDHYRAGLAAYRARLDALGEEIAATLKPIPPERRLLVTTHDSFRYFAAETGFRTAALQGISAESEPSAADMARIIRQLRQLKAPAVFLETITDPRKITEIARESGAVVAGTLYSDALSLETGPAATYIDMMRYNMRQIAGALIR